MDVAVVIGVVGAIATIAAVIVTHVLSQRGGEKRANQVLAELTEKCALLDRRVTEVRDVLSGRMDGVGGRITEVKSDVLERVSDISHQISDHKVQTERQFELARIEAAAHAANLKESMQIELRAVKAEIIAALPQRSQQAGQS